MHKELRGRSRWDIGGRCGRGKRGERSWEGKESERGRCIEATRGRGDDGKEKKREEGKTTRVWKRREGREGIRDVLGCKEKREWKGM